MAPPGNLFLLDYFISVPGTAELNVAQNMQLIKYCFVSKFTQFFYTFILVRKAGMRYNFYVRVSVYMLHK